MKQKYIKPTGMVSFTAYMQMFVPLSIDLYLPALPKMAEVFSASEFLVNLTLAGFFLVFAVGIILFGPLADLFGDFTLQLVDVFTHFFFCFAAQALETFQQLCHAALLTQIGYAHFFQRCGALCSRHVPLKLFF